MTPSKSKNVGISRVFGIRSSGFGKPKTPKALENEGKNEGVKK